MDLLLTWLEDKGMGVRIGLIAELGFINQI